MIGVKWFARLKDTKSDVNKFAHGSADDLHFVFTISGQALTEVTGNRIVLLGDHGWQKERLAQSGISGL